MYKFSFIFIKKTINEMMKKIINKKFKTLDVFVINDDFIELFPKKYPEKFVDKMNIVMTIKVRNL
nr:hypothetical protein GTC16762_14060 [Pigmentibacter ruber]